MVEQEYIYWTADPPNNMVRGGEPDDDRDGSSHGSRKRPSYNGTSKAWPAFRVKAEAYFELRGQLKTLEQGLAPGDKDAADSNGNP